MLEFRMREDRQLGMLFWGWRGSSADKSTGCSSRGAEFNSQNTLSCLQSSIIPAPGDPMLSSDFCGHLNSHAYTHIQIHERESICPKWAAPSDTSQNMRRQCRAAVLCGVTPQMMGLGVNCSIQCSEGCATQRRGRGISGCQPCKLAAAVWSTGFALPAWTGDVGMVD